MLICWVSFVNLGKAEPLGVANSCDVMTQHYSISLKLGDLGQESN
jgi:hypothetical protein